jgi:hypothetical protein
MRITFLSVLLAAASMILPLQQATAADTQVSVSVIQPDTDFSKYDKFMIQPLDIGETRLIPPPWIEGKVLFDHWGEYLRLALDAEKQTASPK